MIANNAPSLSRLPRCFARTIGSLMNETFTYDDAQYITDKGTDSYTLDDLYRITADNSDSYTYDAIGNRTAKNSDAYVYPSTSSKVTSIDSVSVTHDASGNITDDGTREYVIDAAGRMESVEISSSIVGEYVYDANNLRTEKTVSSVTTHYVYGMGGKLYGEYDASGNMIREYVYLNGEPLAQIDDVSSSDVLTYLHTDHQGTPRYATNTSGTQVWAWSSDAFGVGTPTGSATVNLRFPGQYFDDESDLHYNWNRYYDPETGRYITSDPIGLAGGLNTYLYAMANPVMYIDPEGLQTVVDAVLAGAAAGVVGVRAGSSVVRPQAPKTGCPATDPGDLVPNSSANTSNEDQEKGESDESENPKPEPLPENPDDLKEKGYIETTHPEAGKKGHRTFENPETGDKVRHDKGKEGAPGHEGQDHYHRPNPDKTSKHDEFLDKDGNPTGRHSDASHVYAEE